MDVVEFFRWDFDSTLFPLKTNLLLIEKAPAELAEFCVRILSDAPESVAYSFLPQARAYAAKPKNHLRRTIVLDPVCSYFLYDLVWRNRSAFDPKGTATRRSFGYHFEGDNPVPVHKAYSSYCDAVSTNISFVFGHSLSFDVASYFNTIYHHDAINWFAALDGVSGVDSNAFGRFFREINSGRTVDFLPQGIYPAKMIGSGFLSYVEMSGELKSAEICRFMDDFYLFDEVPGVLTQDFYRMQKLLGLRGLNVNPTKTLVDHNVASLQFEANSLKKEIMDLTGSEGGKQFLASGVDPSDESDESDEDAEADEDVEDDDGIWVGDGFGEHLLEDADGEDEQDAEGDAASDDDKINRLLELLVDPQADENDVEAILNVLKGHDVDLATYIPGLFAKFPSIAKQLCGLCDSVPDGEVLADGFAEVLQAVELTEFQLFWMAVLFEDHLSDTAAFDPVVLLLYERTVGSKIARAKVLEIPTQGAGMKEIRAEILKTGSSEWESWAAAVGTRTLKKAERNHVLKYFAKGSLLNHLIAECVMQFP